MRESNGITLIASALRRGVAEADGFLRLHFLFFTWIWPLLGAVSVRPDIRIAELSGVLTATFCFHVFSFVLNDVVDLPIDRTQPMRQTDPLVRGVIGRGQALALALAQPVLSALLGVALGVPASAQVTLAAAYVLMGAYDVWGKRCPVPPVTDLVLGLGWGLLAVYAAQVLAGGPNALTWMVAAYSGGFMLFMNGIHGGLRDLDNDFAQGARTTAIFLGARPSGEDRDPFVPPAVGVFAAAVLTLLVAINIALVLRNDFGYTPRTLAATATGMAALNLIAVLLHPKVVRPRRPTWDAAFRLQMYAILMSLPVAFAAYTTSSMWILFLALTALTLALIGCTGIVVNWAWRGVRSALQLARGKTMAPTVPRIDV
jgi:4-hydroxybenzoate polyprenyltransferase